MKINLPKNKLIIIVFFVIVAVGLFLFFKPKALPLPQNTAPIESAWQLPANDGIGQATLNLFNNNIFSLSLDENKNDWRTGTWQLLPDNFLELKFTDKKQTYDMKNNKYFEDSRVIDKYTVQLKISGGPRPYINFFNYFFYKK